MLTRLLNITLRAATALSRFMLFIFFARYLDPIDLSYFSLFVATVSFSVQLVGLEFSSYSSREIVKTPKFSQGKVINAHLILLTITFFSFAGPSIFVIKNVGWPSILIYFFLPILALELLAQDSSRLLISLSKQTSASLIMFLRHGSWVGICIIIMWKFEEARQISSILLAWFFAGLVATYISFTKLRIEIPQSWKVSMGWAWIRKGVTISFGFVLSTSAMQAILTIDRYSIGSTLGIETIAPYALFFGIAHTLIVLIEAAFLSFSVPKMIKYWHGGDISAFRNEMSFLSKWVSATAILFMCCSIFILPKLVDWIDNPIYTEAQFLYYWIIPSIVLYAISTVPHVALYASGSDRSIWSSHVCALIIFTIGIFFGNIYFQELAVLVPLVICFTTLAAWKWVAINKLLLGIDN